MHVTPLHKQNNDRYGNITARVRRYTTVHNNGVNDNSVNGRLAGVGQTMPTSASLLYHGPLSLHAIDDQFKISTRMSVNAQRDGRPAEHRRRPLFNAAKFG